MQSVGTGLVAAGRLWEVARGLEAVVGGVRGRTSVRRVGNGVGRA